MSRPGKAASQRQLRVGEAMRHALAGIMMRGVNRSAILREAAVTITEVRVSPDLRNATVFYAPLAGRDADAIAEALKEASPQLRSAVAREVTLKVVPRLIFTPDTSFDEAHHINSLLAQATGTALNAAGRPRSLADRLAEEGEDDDDWDDGSDADADHPADADDDAETASKDQDAD